MHGMDSSAGTGLLQGIAPDHLPALIAPLALPLLIWLFLVLTRSVAGSGFGPAVRWLHGYENAPTTRRIASVLMLVTAAIHLALVPGHAHADPGLARAFAVNGALFAVLAVLSFAWRWWRPAAATLLVLTIFAYVSAIGKAQEDPDQLGIATKLVELAALALVLVPAHKPGRAWTRGLRWAGMTAAVLLLTVLTGASVWAATFRPERAGTHDSPSASGAHRPDHHDDLSRLTAGQGIDMTAMDGRGHHNHAGMVMQPVPSTPPTPEQRQAAARLAADTRAGIAKYQDIAVAIADGYRAGTAPAGPTVHYTNPAYVKDGRILDPTRPESLVYANTKHGPVLMGAMYMMPKQGMPGPDIGGSITRWHMHDNVCFGANLMIVGVLSPFGTCPIGSVNVPTPEMLHVWTVELPDGPFSDPADSAIARFAQR